MPVYTFADVHVRAILDLPESEEVKLVGMLTALVVELVVTLSTELASESKLPVLINALIT